MTDKKEPCAHPRMCPEADDFTTRVKTQKLALESPPPADLLAGRPGKKAKNE
jgi:hypothetical protein